MLNLVVEKEKDVSCEILKKVASNDREKSELAKIIVLTQVSKKWNLHIKSHFAVIYGISLFERGAQVFADELITMAFVGKKTQDSEAKADLIKTLIRAAMLNKMNQLNFSNIKFVLELLVTNCRFKYSSFYITILQNLMKHPDSAVKKYILTQHIPYLLKNNKPLNNNGRDSLSLYAPQKSSWNVILLLVLIIGVLYKLIM